MRDFRRLVTAFGGYMAFARALREEGASVTDHEARQWVKTGFPPERFDSLIVLAAFARGIFASVHELRGWRPAASATPSGAAAPAGPRPRVASDRRSTATGDAA